MDSSDRGMNLDKSKEICVNMQVLPHTKQQHLRPVGVRPSGVIRWNSLPTKVKVKPSSASITAHAWVMVNILDFKRKVTSST